MNKTYRISNDGTIFEIKDDGSIAKLAKINDQGYISAISGTVMSANRENKGGYWFFIVIFAIIAIVLSFLYIRVNRERNGYKSKYENELSVTSSLRSEISSLKQERDNAKSEFSIFKNKVSSVYPLIITDIEIANVAYNGDIHTNYGNFLYGNSTMYLRPRIRYTGLTSGDKTLKVKWYNPDGSIRRGASSPFGFSQSQSVYICSGENNSYILSGWGNSSKGSWRSGSYRIEIWYDNLCLKSKSFTIY